MMESNNHTEEKSDIGDVNDFGEQEGDWTTEIAGNENILNSFLDNTEVDKSDYAYVSSDLPIERMFDYSSDQVLEGKGTEISGRCDMYVEAIRCLRVRENYSEEARAAAMYVYYRKTTPLKAVQSFKVDFEEILQSQRTLMGLNAQLGKIGMCETLPRLLDEIFSVVTSKTLHAPQVDNNNNIAHSMNNPDESEDQALHDAVEELLPCVLDSIRLLCREEELESLTTISENVNSFIRKGISILSMKIYRHYHTIITAPLSTPVETSMKTAITIIQSLLDMLSRGLLCEPKTDISDFLREGLFTMTMDLLENETVQKNVNTMIAILRIFTVIFMQDSKAIPKQQGKKVLVHLDALLKRTIHDLNTLIVPPLSTTPAEEHTAAEPSPAGDDATTNDEPTPATEESQATTIDGASIEESQEKTTTSAEWVADFDNFVPFQDPEAQREEIILRLKIVGLISGIVYHMLVNETSLLSSLLDSYNSTVVHKTNIFTMIFDQVFLPYHTKFLVYDKDWADLHRILCFLSAVLPANSSIQKVCLEENLWAHIDTWYDRLLSESLMKKEVFVVALVAITLQCWKVMRLHEGYPTSSEVLQPVTSVLRRLSFLGSSTTAATAATTPSSAVSQLSTTTKAIIEKVLTLLRNYRFKTYSSLHLFDLLCDLVINFKCIKEDSVVSVLLNSRKVMPGVQSVFDINDAFVVVCEMLSFMNGVVRITSATISIILRTNFLEALYYTSSNPAQPNTLGTIWTALEDLLRRMCDNKYSIDQHESFSWIVSILAEYCMTAESILKKEKVLTSTEKPLAIAFKNAIVCHFDNLIVQKRLLLAINLLIRVGLKKGTRSFSATLNSIGFWDLAVITWDKYLLKDRDIAIQGFDLVGNLIGCNQNAFMFIQPLPCYVPVQPDTEQMGNGAEVEDVEFEDFQQAASAGGEKAEEPQDKLEDDGREDATKGEGIASTDNTFSTSVAAQLEEGKSNEETINEVDIANHGETKNEDTPPPTINDSANEPNEDGCARCLRTLKIVIVDPIEFSNVLRGISTIHKNLVVRKHFHQDPFFFATIFQGFTDYYYPVRKSAKYGSFLLISVLLIITNAASIDEEHAQHLLSNYPIAKLLCEQVIEKSQVVASTDFLGESALSEASFCLQAINAFFAWPSCRAPFMTFNIGPHVMHLMKLAKKKPTFAKHLTAHFQDSTTMISSIYTNYNPPTTSAAPTIPSVRNDGEGNSGGAYNTEEKEEEEEEKDEETPTRTNTASNTNATTPPPAPTITEQARATANSVSQRVGQTVSRFSSFWSSSTTTSR